MVEKDQILKETMDHTGLFSFSDFYTYAHTWLKDNLYGVNEERYGEKVSGNAREINFEWKAIRNLTDYFRIEMIIRITVKGLVDVEVEIDGKKKKMNKGNISMDLRGNLIKDPKSTWDETKPIYKFLRELYDKYIIPKRIVAMEEKIEFDARAFKDELKAFLELTGQRGPNK